MAENHYCYPSGISQAYPIQKGDSKLHLLIHVDVWTMYAGALVSDSLLHMSPY